MIVEVVNQFAGADPVAVRISEQLASGRWTRFRYIVAFARWSGLSLIDHELRDFANSGGFVDGFVGIDLGGTTIEALTYLYGLPNSRLRIVSSGNSRIIFHPKVYIFDGPDGWLAIAGSSNLSSGGLHSNAEVCLQCEGAAHDGNPFEDAWDRYDLVQHPLQAQHVFDVDAGALVTLAELLEPYTTAAPDTGAPVLPNRRPVELTAPLPPIGRPPQPGTTGPSGPVITAPTTPGDTLYIELWSETGTDGTQVQIPKKVAVDYFGLGVAVVTWLRLETPTGHRRVQVLSFGNFTYRIQLAFTSGVRRPAVLRFRRVGADHYVVKARTEGARGYDAWLRRCTEQTRRGSKRYGYQSNP